MHKRTVVGIGCRWRKAVKHSVNRGHTVVDMAALANLLQRHMSSTFNNLRDNINTRQFVRSPHPTEPITVNLVVRVTPREVPRRKLMKSLVLSLSCLK